MIGTVPKRSESLQASTVEIWRRSGAARLAVGLETGGRVTLRGRTSEVSTDRGSRWRDPGRRHLMWIAYALMFALASCDSGGSTSMLTPSESKSQVAPVKSPAAAGSVGNLTADQPFDYLGIGDAGKYWPQWLEAQKLLANSLHAKHITSTDAGHFVGVENPTVVVQQICALLDPPRVC